MAVRIVEGVPGSGKTYYAVHHLLTNYFRWNDEEDRWVAKSTDVPVEVYSNVDGLKLGKPLDRAIASAGGINKFFTIAHQEKKAQSCQLVYVIDEAQMWFGRTFRDTHVFAFFQWARHLGVEIYLITQDVNTLAVELRNLAEYNVRAARRTLSMMGEFRYHFHAGSDKFDEPFHKKALRRDQKVFSVYRSMLRDETEKLPSAPRRMLITFAALILLSFLGGWWAVRHWSGAREATASTSVSSGTSRKGYEQQRALERRLPDPVVVASVVASPAPARSPEWIRRGFAKVLSVVGSEVDGRVHVEMVEEGELLERWYAIGEFTGMCRCYPVGLRPGGRVMVWSAPATELPAPATERAPVWRAPAGEPPGGTGARAMVTGSGVSHVPPR